ncbi:MAG: hypothetical protein JO041_01690, partial [Acidobacteria bacterium]|nr:hypothetical protein [Acidobacteriota bacterium]
MLSDSLAAFLRAGDADPLYLYPMVNAAETLIMLGRLDEAWKENESAASIEPDNLGVLKRRAWILYLKGRMDEAEQVLQYASSRVEKPEYSQLEFIHGWILSRRGAHEQARALLRRLEAMPVASRSLDVKMWLAEGWALENQPSRSIPVLRKLAKVHPNYPWFLVDPNLQSLRTNAEYQALLQGLKLAWENNRAQFKPFAQVIPANY